MLRGTTIWWERDGDGWVNYYADKQDVCGHVFGRGLGVDKVLVKIYDHALSFKEKNTIFMREAPLFTTKANRKAVVLKEWGG